MSSPVTTPSITPTSEQNPSVDLLKMADEFADLQHQLELARTEVDTLRRQRDIREADFAHFRERVPRIAMRYAREHNWCSVVTDALDDLGLQPPSVRVNGEFTVTYTFTAYLDASHHRDLNDGFIRDSIQASVSDGVSLDSDWSDAEISVETVDVSCHSIDDDED